MDSQVSRLVEKVWAKYLDTPSDQRLMIAIAGIPGSGKTTLSKTLTSSLNKIDPSLPHPPATFLPMDGFHYPLSYLRALPDPEHALARRGAPFTFDAGPFLDLVRDLRRSIGGTIYAPSFDHSVKDPVADDIPIQPYHRIVVFEGNYLALDEPVWRDAAALMDELWLVEVDFEVARRRLIKRHVEAGIAANEDEADKRAQENDLVNGKLIIDRLLPVEEIIHSKEDDRWSHP